MEVLRLGDVGLTAARRRVADALRAGELVVAPTDTVYGLVADVTQAEAVERLFTARGTGRDVPPTVLLHNPRFVAAVARAVPEAAERLMAAYWPGPLTVALAAQEGIDWELGAHGEALCVRMPAEALLLQVGYDVGPLACSAASRAGQPPPTTAGEARGRLGDGVALYVDDGPRDGAPSTVVDLTRGRAEVLREGAVPAADVEAVASGGLDWGERPGGQQENGGQTAK